MAEKSSFVFYRGFFDAIEKLDEGQQLSMFKAIANYGLNKTEPNLDGVLSILWDLVKPQLDANWKKFDNGCKGGEFGKLGGNPNFEKGKRNPYYSQKDNPKITPTLPQDNPTDNPKITPTLPQDNPKITPNDNDNVSISNNISNNNNSSITSNNIISSSSSSSTHAYTDTHVCEGAQADAQTLTPVHPQAIANIQPPPPTPSPSFWDGEQRQPRTGP